MSKRTLTSMLVSLLLAVVPATAFADGGAGDNQYQDPLAAPPPAKRVKKKATAPTPAVAPASSAAPAATTTPAAPAPVAAPAASTRQLPRTGFPAGLIGMGGVTLILAGIALRRRTLTQ